jgi:hypothetical protein
MRLARFLVLLAVLLSACSADRITPVPVPVTEISTVLPTASPPADRLVFSLPNSQVFSGRENDPRPDWLGWGAETFDVAPDGSFWLADNYAEPARLLHFSAQGDLLAQFPLDGIASSVYSLDVTSDALWIASIWDQPAQVKRLSLEGEVLGSWPVPDKVMADTDGYVVSNGLYNLRVLVDGSVVLDGINGPFELLDPAGTPTARPLDGLPLAGHVFKVVADDATLTTGLYLDGRALDIQPPYYLDNAPVLGVGPDGRVAVAVRWQEAQDQPGEARILYFDLTGKPAGVSRPWPRLLWRDWNHDLAFGPDGSVYQLVSNADHAVQVVELAVFPSADVLPPVQAAPAWPAPPALEPLARAALPADAGDADLARDALIAFFDALHAGDYATTVDLYGGRYDEIFGEERPAGESHETTWLIACQAILCLPVGAIDDGQQVSGDDFLFYVEFVSPEGARFEMGGCCGADPAQYLTVWQFAYHVKKIDGRWKVMRAPLYVP